MSLEDVELNLVTTLDEALAFKRWLGERHENNAVAVDTETSGLDPRSSGARIRLIQFGDTQHGWAIPWQDWRGLALEALAAWSGDVIYHNCLFERRWLETHSDFRYDPARSWDTMIAAHIIDPLGSGALKSLSRKYIDKRATAGQSMLDTAMFDNKWTWDTIPITFEPFWVYGSLDSVLTARLWDRFRKKVGPGAVYSNVMELEMAVLDVVGKMERRGAAVDLEYSALKKQELIDSAVKAKEWAKDTYGILLTSPQQLGKLLMSMGVEITEQTPTGQPKVDKDLLRLLSNPHNHFSAELQNLATQALAARESTKMASAYFGNFLDTEQDGIIRPAIKTLGARTARMSISHPPLQQLPSKDGLVRRAFVPRSEDTCIVTCDFSQVESRIFAHFSNDVRMMDAFNVADRTGGDFFVELGKSVYRDPHFTKKDPRRKDIKILVYSTIYGAGVAKMAKTAAIPVERMQAVADAFNASYPGVRRFMKAVESVGFQRQRTDGQGYVITPIGRRLPCDEDRVYTLNNYLVQSSAADVLKKAMVRLDASEYGEYMILPVHDEVVFDMPKELEKDALREIPEIMRDRSFKVDLPAEAEGGFSNWGEKYD
jgi:DNA polymerase-1